MEFTIIIKNNKNNKNKNNKNNKYIENIEKYFIVVLY